MVDAARSGRYAAALAIVSLSALLLTPFYFQRQIDRQRQIVVQTLDPIRDGASDVRLDLAREVGAIRGYLLTRDRALISEYLDAREAEERALEEMKQVHGVDSTFRRLVMQADVSSHEWNASNDELAAGKIAPEQSLARLHEQLTRYRAALDAGEAIEQEYTTRISAIRQTVIDIERHWAIASIALAVLAAAAGVIVIMIMRSAVTEAQLARTDALTGLLNRRGFDELAERELSRAHRTSAAITLVAFDVDGFKHVNDNLGHAAGDRLLALIGSSIRRAIRDIDVAARLGGDEFAVLLPDNKATPPERAAERVRDVVIQSLRQDHWSATLSGGAVTVRGYRAPIDEMIHSADKLLYQAKAAGKDTLRHQELKS